MLIGGADSIFEEEYGERIDQFDIVVRVNKGVELIDCHWKYVGTRTDFLFHCFFEDVKQSGSPVTPELWCGHGVENVVKASYARASEESLFRVFRRFSRGGSCSELPDWILEDAKGAIGGYLPTTGFLALFSILAGQPAHLHIRGITFLKTPHCKAYRNISIKNARNLVASKGIHNPESEFSWFCDALKDIGDCITTDATLSEIVEQSR